MAYTKYQSNWQDGSGGGTPITEAALDHIEQGIYDAHGPAWAFTAYTPSWTASGSAPALGNGTLTGRYLQIGDLVVVRVGFTAGTTTTFGTGGWRFSLPVTPTADSFQGSGWAIDSSVPASYALLVRAPEPSQTYMTTLTTASPGALVESTVPFAWASTDILRLTTMYEAA